MEYLFSIEKKREIYEEKVSVNELPLWADGNTD